jgi:hypothetical protein
MLDGAHSMGFADSYPIQLVSTFSRSCGMRGVRHRAQHAAGKNAQLPPTSATNVDASEVIDSGHASHIINRFDVGKPYAHAPSS